MFKRLLPMMMLVGASQAWAATSYYVGDGRAGDFGTDLGLGGLSPSAWTNFAGITPGTTSVTVADVTFTGPNNFDVDSGTTLKAPVFVGNSVTITFTGTVEAIAFHLSIQGSGATWCLDVCGGDNQLSLSTSPLFFGIINTAGISSVTLQSFGGSPLLISDFQTGTPITLSDAPEPASMALMGSALAGLGIMVQKRKRRADLPPASER